MTTHKDPPTGTTSADKEPGTGPAAQNRSRTAQAGKPPNRHGLSSQYYAQNQNEEHLSQTSRDHSYTGFPASLFSIPPAARAKSALKGHWALACGALAALALALFYLLKAVPSYTSSVDLLIDVSARGAAAIAVPSSMVGDSGDSKSQFFKNLRPLPASTNANPTTTANATIENQIHIITSPLLLEKIVAAQQLGADPDYLSQSQNWVSRALQTVGFATHTPVPRAVSSSAENTRNASASRRLALQRFAKSVKVERLGQSYVLRLSVTAPSKEKAPRLATALAQGYLDFNRNRRAAAIQQIKSRRDQHLSELRGQLKQSEDRLQQMRRTYLAGLANGSLIDEPGVKRAADTAGAATAVVQEAQQVYNSIKAVRRAYISGKGENGGRRQNFAAPPIVPAALASPYLRKLRDVYAAQLQRHAALSIRLLPRHPRIQYVRAQLRSLARQIRGELDRGAARARQALARARRQARNLAANLTVQKNLLSKSLDMRANLLALRRDVAISRQAISGFLSSSSAAPSPSFVLYPSAVILSPASLSSASPKSELISFLIVTLITGLVLLLAYWVLVQQFFRRADAEPPSQTVDHSPTEFEDEFESEVDIKSTGAEAGGYESRRDIDNDQWIAPPRRAAAPPSLQRAPSSQHHPHQRSAHNDISPAEPVSLSAVSALSAAAPAKTDPLAGAALGPVATGQLQELHTVNRSNQQSQHTGAGTPTPARLSHIIAALGDNEEAGKASSSARKFQQDITNLLGRLHQPQRDRSQIIVLQSPGGGDGHTALSLALALIGAAQNLRVLLIDADHKSRNLSHTFTPPAPVHNAAAADPNNLSALLLQDEDSGVHFLPLPALSTSSIGQQENPKTPSTSSRTTTNTNTTKSNENAAPLVLNGISTLAENYDLTLIDGGGAPPPVGAAQQVQLTRDLINLADQVLICESIKSKTGKRKANAKRAPRPSATSIRPPKSPQGWQILSCKRVQGAQIVATVSEPA